MVDVFQAFDAECAASKAGENTEEETAGDASCPHCNTVQGFDLRDAVLLAGCARHHHRVVCLSLNDCRHGHGWKGS